MKTLEQIKRDAAKFSKRWSGKSLDKYKDFKPFWLNFFERVIGVDNATAKIEFDKSVETPEGKKKHVGAYVPEIGLLIIQTKHLPEKDPLPTKAGEPWPDAMMDFYKQVLPNINLLGQQGCPVKFIIASDYKLWFCFNRNYSSDYPGRCRCKWRNLGKDVAYLEYVFNLARNKDELELRRAAIDDILLGYGINDVVDDTDAVDDDNAYTQEEYENNFFDHVHEIKTVQTGPNETTVSAMMTSEDSYVYYLDFIIGCADIYDAGVDDVKHARISYRDAKYREEHPNVLVYEYGPVNGYDLFEKVRDCIAV